MRFPAISIPLIAAIIACPIWCGSGLVPCCAQDISATSMPAHDAPCCGRCEDASHQQHGDLPQNDCPQHTTQCQGICGGAVVENADPAIDSDELIQPCLAFVDERSHSVTIQPDRTADPIQFSSGNLGRFVRTLHASFLC